VEGKNSAFPSFRSSAAYLQQKQEKHKSLKAEEYLTLE